MERRGVLSLFSFLALLFVLNCSVGWTAPAPAGSPHPSPSPIAASPSAETATPSTSSPFSTPSPEGPDILDQALKDNPKDTSGVDVWRQMGLTLFYLILISGLIMVTLKVIYGRGSGSVTGPAPSGPLRRVRILERHMLSTQKGLLLVEVGQKMYLIGVTDQSMTCLAELDAASLPTPTADDAGVGPFAFQQVLTQWFGRK